MAPGYSLRLPNQESFGHDQFPQNQAQAIALHDTPHVTGAAIKTVEAAAISPGPMLWINLSKQNATVRQSPTVSDNPPYSPPTGQEAIARKISCSLSAAD